MIKGSGLIQVDARGCLITNGQAQYLVDQAVARGYSRSALRWRISFAQKHAMDHFLFTVADSSFLRQMVVNGSGETGQFAGVPYIVDDSVGKSQIRLEVIRETEIVGNIENCAVTREDAQCP